MIDEVADDRISGGVLFDGPIDHLPMALRKPLSGATAVRHYRTGRWVQVREFRFPGGKGGENGDRENLRNDAGAVMSGSKGTRGTPPRWIPHLGRHAE